ncbi:MAG TPA: hypothetical protein VJ797_15535 [Burkholderiales bacterium]|nr:hypothetical protein [Burkholderiales bacterium]
MSASGYSCTTEGAVALSAATAKTIIGVKAHANSGLQCKGFAVAFDGVTASAVPVLVEFCYATFATNSPGTNSTSTTPRQTYGRVLTAGFTSGKTWTTEPTALTVIKEFLLAPDKGLFAYQFPLGQEPDTALAEGLVIRCTAPATVNVRSSMDVERI